MADSVAGSTPSTAPQPSSGDVDAPQSGFPGGEEVAAAPVASQRLGDELAVARMASRHTTGGSRSGSLPLPPRGAASRHSTMQSAEQSAVLARVASRHSTVQSAEQSATARVASRHSTLQSAEQSAVARAASRHSNHSLEQPVGRLASRHTTGSQSGEPSPDEPRRSRVRHDTAGEISVGRVASRHTTGSRSGDHAMGRMVSRYTASSGPMAMWSRGGSALSCPVMRTTFTDYRVLRASPIKVLLTRFGSILSENDGKVENYELSEPAEGGMDWFVSHNWSTNRFKKFATLALFWNFRPAVILTVLAMSAIMALTAAGVLPLVEEYAMDSIEETPERRVGVCAQMSGPWVFLFFLFTWHEVGARIGLMNTTVFFDKTCINQVDPTLKDKGIMGLAAFLEKSAGMLVVYTGSYLSRLWTVFELASLLILFPSKTLEVLPVFFVTILVEALLTVHLVFCVYMLSRMKVFEDLIADWALLSVSILFGFACMLAVYVTCQWSQRGEEMRKAIESFRLSAAACADESDRPVVLKSVEQFMRWNGFVPGDSSREETLLAFEKLVHVEVPGRLLYAHGPVGVPYKYMAAMFLPQSFRMVDIVGAYIHDGEDLGVIFLTVGNYLTAHLLTKPLLMGLVALVMGRCSRQHGWRKLWLVVGNSVGALTAYLALYLWMGWLKQRAMESAVGVAGYLACITLEALVTWYIFCGLAATSATGGTQRRLSLSSLASTLTRN